MRGYVDVVVGELGAFEVVRVFVGEDFLEGRGVDFIGCCFAVDGVLEGGILDLEDAVCVYVKIVAARCRDRGFGHGVPCSVRVEGGTWHGVCFFVDDSVERAIDHGVDSQRKYVLVVGC